MPQYLLILLTIDSASDLVDINETATAIVTSVFLSTSENDTISVSVVPVSYPAGHSKAAKISVLKSVYAQTAQPGESNSIDISITESAKVKLAAYLQLSVPNLDYAGTYVFRIVPTLKNGSGFLNSTSLTWTITVWEPNFKIHLTNSASSSGNRVQFALTNPKDNPDNAWAVKEFTTDANDDIQTYLENGTYEVRLYPNLEEATTRVPSAAYTFVIKVE